MNTEGVPRQMTVRQQSWPIAGSFTIARGARTKAETVLVEITCDGHSGRGECTPYPRYGESPESVIRQIMDIKKDIEMGLNRETLQEAMPAGAARNAIDCALWDLEAKRSGIPCYQTAGLSGLHPNETAFTISLGAPEKMAKDASAASSRTLLKIKLGADGDKERMIAVRESASNARLILDANEGWTPKNIELLSETAQAIGAELIEQPLPAENDEVLQHIERAVPICADESLHTRDGLSDLRTRYDAINIKLDKTGGLTEALALQKEARALGFSIMIGCMVSSSLAMAPAMMLAQDADFVDLDGPLLLAKDCEHPIEYPGSQIMPPSRLLWG